MKPKIIIICGPTGTGKTSTAIDLASVYKGEIIGADSMQIYKYMDIGTAKPTKEEQALIKHHMVDIVEPDENFDAHQYALLAGNHINDLNNRRLVPFVVGGTGFYIKAVLHGLFETEKENTEIREDLKKMAKEKGTGYLHEQLCKYDPEAGEKIHPNDTYRIIRAMEIHSISGKSISEYQAGHGFRETLFDSLKIGLEIKRSDLYECINKRTEMMVESGLVEEVKSLLKLGYSPALKSMQSIGYRHMIDYLKNDVSWEESIRIFKRDTRRYAKRQVTWFKSDPDIHWIKPSDIQHMRNLIDDFLI